MPKIIETNSCHIISKKGEKTKMTLSKLCKKKHQQKISQSSHVAPSPENETSLQNRSGKLALKKMKSQKTFTTGKVPKKISNDDSLDQVGINVENRQDTDTLTTSHYGTGGNQNASSKRSRKDSFSDTINEQQLQCSNLREKVNNQYSMKDYSPLSLFDENSNYDSEISATFVSTSCEGDSISISNISDYEDKEISDDLNDSDNSENIDFVYFRPDIIFNDTDEYNSEGDYILPPTVQKGVVMPNGLAQIRDLQSHDAGIFDSDNKEMQIQELKNVQTKRIEHETHKKGRLEKFKSATASNEDLKDFLYKEGKQIKINRINSDVCPELIPVLEFRNRLSNEAEVICNGFISDSSSSYNDYFDVNMKYQTFCNNTSISCDHCETTQQEEEALLNRSQVHVINAEECLFKSLNEILPSESDNIKIDNSKSFLEQLSSTVECDNEITNCTIVTTSFIDESITNLVEDSHEKDRHHDVNGLIMPKEDSMLMSPLLMCNDLSNRSKLKHNEHLFCNAIDDNEVFVLLREPIYFYGTVRLTVLLGVTQIYGYIPPLNQELEIFSPRGCSSMKLEVLPHNKNRKDKNEEQKSQKLRSKLEEIFEKYRHKYFEGHLKRLLNSFQSQTDAIVLLSRNVARKRLQQQFHKYMDQNIFPNMKNLNVDRPLYESEYRLRCIINTSKELKSLKIPRQWQNLVLNQKSKILVTGGKAVGKSTLLRYLVNKHLPQFERILFIDLDIGQPELFVPQTVSCYCLKQPLIGPGFMLNLQPDKSYAVGHTNIVTCPYIYVWAVKELIKFCNDQLLYKNIPWLINTMGYNKGFGLELLSVITNDLILTDLIQIQSTKDINNYDCLLYPDILYNTTRQIFLDIEYKNNSKVELSERAEYCLHVWKSVINDSLPRQYKEWDMGAKDLRYANILSRLTLALTQNSEWITDCKPLKARLSDLKLINLQENMDCTREQLLSAIEADLVYLCQYKSINDPLECLGLGIVRGVDYNLNEVYLVPAMPLETLVHVNCLAIGEMPLPSTLFTNQGPKVLNMIPFVYNTIDANSSKAIKHIIRRYDDIQGHNCSYNK